MLKAAAAWLQLHDPGQTPTRGFQMWRFLGTPACAEYLELGLVRVAAHYHQHMPAASLGTSKDPCFWEEMLEQLMSGFIIHFLLQPAGKWNQGLADI